MIIKEIFLPGSFEEAYLYQGHLLLIGKDRRFQAFNLEELVSAQIGLLKTPEQRAAFEYLFARNDWFAQEPVKKMLQNQAISKIFWETISSLPDQTELDPDTIGRRTDRDLGLAASYIFDLEFYRRRMYIATELGLMYQDLDWNSSDLKLTLTDTKVGARCVSVSAAYGVVDASCGDDGLIVAAHDSKDYLGANIPTSQVEKQVAERSIRSGWLDSSIVNYSSSDSPEVHKTKTEKALPNIFGDSKMVTDIDNEGKDLLKELSSYTGSEVPSSSLFIHNSTKNLFTQPSVNTFLSVILDSNIPGGVRHVESYEGPGARLLTAEGTSFGLLAKTRKNVVLYAGGEWIEMHPGPVSCLRSFAKSKRYKNLICICDKEGLHLKAVITQREIPFYGHPATKREIPKQDRIRFV